MTTTKQHSWSTVALKLGIKIFTPVHEAFNGTDLVHVFLHSAAPWYQELIYNLCQRGMGSPSSAAACPCAAPGDAHQPLSVEAAKSYSQEHNGKGKKINHLWNLSLSCALPSCSRGSSIFTDRPLLPGKLIISLYTLLFFLCALLHSSLQPYRPSLCSIFVQHLQCCIDWKPFTTHIHYLCISFQELHSKIKATSLVQPSMQIQLHITTSSAGISMQHACL